MTRLERPMRDGLFAVSLDLRQNKALVFLYR